MKKAILFLLSLFTLFLSSCNAKEEMGNVKTEAPSINKVKMEGYQKLVYNNRELLSEWGIEEKEAQIRGTRSGNSGSEKFKAIKLCLYPAAVQFAKDLHISNTDIEEMFGKKLSSQEEYEEAILGLMLFATTSQYSVSPQTRGGDFIDCFQEATGIAAGVALVSALGSKVITKATLKLLVKTAARIGGRTLSGVGLALIAAEMAYCMW